MRAFNDCFANCCSFTCTSKSSPAYLGTLFDIAICSTKVGIMGTCKAPKASKIGDVICMHASSVVGCSTCGFSMPPGIICAVLGMRIWPIDCRVPILTSLMQQKASWNCMLTYRKLSHRPSGGVPRFGISLSPRQLSVHV